MSIIFNSELKNEDFITISSECEGLNFGFGIFESIKIHKGSLLFFNEHIQRLRSSCGQVGMAWNRNSENIRKSAELIIEADGLKEGKLKIIYFKNKTQNDLLITASDKVYPENKYKKGISVMLSSMKKNPDSILCRIKSLNHLENSLAKEDANNKGFDEALFLNTDNYLCEGSASNVFWIKDRCIYTPSGKCGLLPGIIRKLVPEIAKEVGIPFIEGEYEMSDILSAEEVFMTNSIMGIMPVGNIQSTKYHVDTECITHKLLRTYNEIVNNIIES
ncbi:MAG: aminotransferase class IV [Clostridia bacterium]|jgi:4-amino-4-deoxychorismate lyase